MNAPKNKPTVYDTDLEVTEVSGGYNVAVVKRTTVDNRHFVSIRKGNLCIHFHGPFDSLHFAKIFAVGALAGIQAVLTYEYGGDGK